ncbi:hypothetical protein HRI_001836900 [Hibiscus trionum]|uniref:BZIP domain-containing protein n=1 Tax=Hibiscus trionum TaxID=183268 RepID=A0A9W7HQP9_HIBTR|nr:hypothetical protein HRI_001836900 [Hibiscus trionum]
MGDNSLDWATILAGSLDSDEIMSLLMNDVKAENPEDEQLQESSKFQLQPATMVPYQQNTHNVMRNVETGSSSFLNGQNIQNTMMSNGGCLVNPLGFPYAPQMHVDIKGRNKMQETMGEAQQRKRMNKIKNRISAAKSRAKSQEHTRFLEEKVEQLRNENTYLKKLLSLEDAVLPKERKGFEQKRQNSV